MTSSLLSQALPRARSPAPARQRMPKPARPRRDDTESDVTASRLQEGRCLRAAASVCASREEALWLWRRLSALPHLSEAQILLLGPQDAKPRQFDSWRGAWDGLRPASHRGWGARSAALLLAAGLTGALVGGGLGLLANLSSMAALAMGGLFALPALGMALLMRVLARRGSAPRRFDRALRSHLSDGQFAVVVTDVKDPGQASTTLHMMRSVGHYWCAETPRCNV